MGGAACAAARARRTGGTVRGGPDAGGHAHRQPGGPLTARGGRPARRRRRVRRGHARLRQAAGGLRNRGAPRALRRERDRPARPAAGGAHAGGRARRVRLRRRYARGGGSGGAARRRVPRRGRPGRRGPRALGGDLRDRGGGVRMRGVLLRGLPPAQGRRARPAACRARRPARRPGVLRVPAPRRRLARGDRPGVPGGGAPRSAAS